jgi:hypothetical protein
MFERHQHAPRCVYHLADSLDSILAACEDLLGEHIEPSHLLRLELAAITHVLQARRYMEDLDAAEPVLIDQCVLSSRARPHSTSSIFEVAGRCIRSRRHPRLAGLRELPGGSTAPDRVLAGSQPMLDASRLTSCSTKTGMIQ